MFELNPLLKSSEPTSRTVVRVSTSYWNDSRGLHSRKDIIYLKRLCKNFNLIDEECSAIGAEDAYTIIENIDNVSDGIYEVIMTNISRDYETGYIDGYHFKLIPFVGEMNV